MPMDLASLHSARCSISTYKRITSFNLSATVGTNTIDESRFRSSMLVEVRTLLSYQHLNDRHTHVMLLTWASFRRIFCI